MSAIESSRRQLFLKSLEVFSDMITDVSILKESFAIMVNQIKNSDDDEESIKEDLTKVLESGRLTPKVKLLLEYGLKNLHCYYKPKLGRFQDSILLPNLIKNLKFLDMNEANR